MTSYQYPSSNKVLATDVRLGKPPVEAQYKIISVDQNGLMIDEPYLAVSINGSPWFSIDQIKSTELSITRCANF